MSFSFFVYQHMSVTKIKNRMAISWHIFLFVLISYCGKINAGTFEVDYPNHRFLKDGQPFRYISGEIHYCRIHPDLWEDRLQRVRALGFNAIQVYTAWVLHEPTPGK